jgi:hypothetical protein
MAASSRVKPIKAAHKWPLLASNTAAPNPAK